MMFLRCLLLIALAGPVLVAGAEPSPDDSGTAHKIQAALHDLDAPNFVQREAAAEELCKIGREAVVPLGGSAEHGSSEVSVRAFEILQRLYRSDDETTFEAVEQIFEQLKRVDNVSVAIRAERAFEIGAETRQKHAMAQFVRLGGIVHLLEIDPEQQALGRPRIEYLTIGRDWLGGDEGLQLLTRFEDLRNPQYPPTQLFIIRGIQISEQAILDLASELTLINITRRGPARLGIRGSEKRVREGCEISSVEQGSAADRAGLKPMDQVIEIDGQPVRRFDDLIKIIGEKEPGDKVSIVYLRYDPKVERSEIQETIAELAGWSKPAVRNRIPEKP